MEYKLHKCGTYNVHTIKTDKFKTIQMEVVFRNKINKDNIHERTILFDLLTDSSKDYPHKRDLILKEESLYNAQIYGHTMRIGEMAVSKVVLNFLNPKYTEDDYLEEAIKFPLDLIFNPDVKDNKFNEEILTPIKNRMLADIKCIEENPNALISKNCKESMDKDSISSISLGGTEESISNTTTSSLYNTYLDILKNDYVDIFILGDIDEEQVVNIINKYANFKYEHNYDINLYINNKVRDIVNNDSLVKPFKQSHLAYIYNMVDLTEYERKYVVGLYADILGGGSLESKLYKNLRDKNSLCYSVYSMANKNDNLFEIYTQLDKTNIDKAKTLIEQTIKEMDKITEEDLNMAKNIIISELNSYMDIPYIAISQYEYNYYADLDVLEDRINNYSNVKLEEVKAITNKLKLNTVYVLEGDKDGEN